MCFSHSRQAQCVCPSAANWDQEEVFQHMQELVPKKDLWEECVSASDSALICGQYVDLFTGCDFGGGWGGISKDET